MIKTILIDCDGVLTDGRLHIDHKGEKMFKSFHTKDVRAIRELIYHGFEVTIISADDWEGIYHFAAKVGADVAIVRDKSVLDFRDFAAIGDDAWDVPMLKKAKAAFVPQDADDSARSVHGVQVVPCKGGAGVVAAALQDLLSLNCSLVRGTDTPTWINSLSGETVHI